MRGVFVYLQYEIDTAYICCNVTILCRVVRGV